MSSLLQKSMFAQPEHKAPELREYQLDAVERIREYIRGGSQLILGIAPTGAGKTLIFSHIIAGSVAKQNPSLVMAHRIELIDQTVDKLLDAGISPQQLGVIRAKDSRRNPRALVQVASVDTLRNRSLPDAKLVVVDEAHRSLSETQIKIIGHYKKLGATILGLTATPWRLDGKGMGRIYQDKVVVATVQDLIDQEFLVQPLVFSHPDRPDMSDVEVRGGDYSEEQVARAADKKRLIGKIVEHWKLRANGLRTIAFAASVAHSQHIRDAFLAAGVPAEHLDGSTPDGERKAILARFRTGETLVVANCAVLTEGFDEPLAKCCVLARPTKSRILAYQCIGRVMRTVPNRPDITTCIILDHAGCFAEGNHPLPEQITEDEYSLDDEDKNARKTLVTRTCPECAKVSPGAPRECPYCGASMIRQNDDDESKPGPRVLDETDDQLVLRQQVEAHTASLKTKINRFCMDTDVNRGWGFGETNRRLFSRFHKTRTKMDPNELQSVLSYLTSGGFDADNPIVVEKKPEPAAAGETTSVDKTPDWLKSVKSESEEIVDWKL